MDAKEAKRKRDRERYARMTDEEKKERLKKQREAYQLNKRIKETKKFEELEPEKRTDEVVGTPMLSVTQRKPVTPGERQKFLHLRNEEFSTKQRKPVSVSSQEDTSKNNIGNDHIEYLKDPKVMVDGIWRSLRPTNKAADSPPFRNDDEHAKGIDQIMSMIKDGDGDIRTLKHQEVMINEDIDQASYDPARDGRNSLSAEQKEEINAQRIISKRHSLTDEKREEINAHRRARYRAQQNILLDEQKEDTNGHKRAAKQTSTQRKKLEEKAAMLDRRRAKFAAKKNTPCKESIAMPCPIAATITTINLASSTHRTPTGEGTTSPTASPSTEPAPESPSILAKTGSSEYQTNFL